MAIWSVGPVLGPVIGPIAGGFLSESKGWRWDFWLISIVVCFWADKRQTETEN
jgi:MFS family permease